MTELFKHISYATTNAVDVIDTRMQALQANKERLIEEKKNCANGKLKSSEAAVQVVKEYRESFEKTVLKELDGEKDHYL